MGLSALALLGLGLTALLLSCLFLQLANVLSTEALFYTCIIPFICFFGAFAFVFYPLRDVLHPTGAHTQQPFTAALAARYSRS